MPILQGIARGIGQGLTDISAGMAKSSAQWPARRRQGEADDRAERSIALRERGELRQEEEQEERKRAQERLERSQKMTLLQSDYTAAKDRAKMFEKGGVDFVPLAAQERQKMVEIRGKMRKLVIYDGAQKIAREKIKEEGAATTEAPTVEPSATEGPTVPGPPGPPTTGPTAPPSPLNMEATLRRIALTDARDHHNDTLEELRDVANKWGYNEAIGQYISGMGKKATSELTVEARTILKNASKDTRQQIYKKRQNIQAKYLKLIEDRDSPVPSQTVFDQMEAELEPLGGLSKKQIETILPVFQAYDNGLDIGQGEAARLAKIRTIKATSKRALKGITDDELKDLIGGLAGFQSHLEDRIFRWREFLPWELDEEEVLAMRGVINALAGVTDMFGRMQSGAVLNEQEIAFYEKLIGSIGEDAALIRQNLTDLGLQMGEMEDTIWGVAKDVKFGRTDPVKQQAEEAQETNTRQQIPTNPMKNYIDWEVDEKWEGFPMRLPGVK